VWTWVLLLGPMLDLGLGTAAQLFLPKYRAEGNLALLRGYASGTRWFCLGVSAVVAALGVGTGWLLRPWRDDYNVIPLMLSCVCLPAFAVSNIQDGISRSYDWVGLAIVPTYIVRHFLLTVLMGAAYAIGVSVDAQSAMILACIAIWLPVIGQLVMLNGRL